MLRFGFCAVNEGDDRKISNFNATSVSLCAIILVRDIKHLLTDLTSNLFCPRKRNNNNKQKIFTIQKGTEKERKIPIIGLFFFGFLCGVKTRNLFSLRSC